MPTNIPTGQPMSITGTISDKIIFEKTLQIIRSKAIGVYAAATLSATGEGNTDVYRIADMISSQEYTKANKNDMPDEPNVEQIYLHKDNKRKYGYEIEDFDRVDIGSEFSSIEDVIAGSVGLGIAAELDCEFFKAAYNTAVSTTNFTVNAKYSSATTQAEMDTMYFETVDTASAIEGTVDKSIIGVDKTELIAFMKPQAAARFIKNGNGGDKNYSNYMDGQFSEVNGINIKAYPLLGKNISKDQSFSKDKAYDFSKVENLTIHTQAIAFSFRMVKVATNEKAESGNAITIFKYDYGIAILRPKLIYLIANATPTPLTYARSEDTPAQLRGVDGTIADLSKHENKEHKKHMDYLQEQATTGKAPVGRTAGIIDPEIAILKQELKQAIKEAKELKQAKAIKPAKAIKVEPIIADN